MPSPTHWSHLASERVPRNPLAGLMFLADLADLTEGKSLEEEDERVEDVDPDEELGSITS